MGCSNPVLMKYELEALEEFINFLINTYRDEAPDFVIPQFNTKEQFIFAKAFSITRELKSLLFELENESRLETLVQFHQATIIQLVDQLSDSLGQVGASAEGATKFQLWKLLNDQLEILLTFIESHLSKYFDLDKKIPNPYMLLEKNSFNEKLQGIHSQMQTRGIDPVLAELILFPVNAALQMKIDFSITYRRLIYIKQLLKDLDIVLSTDTGSPAFEDIFKLLVYLNFNSSYLIHYVIKKITGEAQEQNHVAGQLEGLCRWLKILNQCHTKPSFALKSSRPSLQEQLTTWLTEEICFIEKKKQLTLLIPPTNQPMYSEGQKIDTVFSVSQLAFLIRLMKETGVITNKNQGEVIRFFSRHFSSLQNQNISPESLRIKYYQVERSTVNSVKSILDKMIELSKKSKWLIFYLSTDAYYNLALDLLLDAELF